MTAILSGRTPHRARLSCHSQPFVLCQRSNTEIVRFIARSWAMQSNGLSTIEDAWQANESVTLSAVEHWQYFVCRAALS